MSFKCFKSESLVKVHFELASAASVVARRFLGSRRPGRCRSSKPVVLMATFVSSAGTQTGNVSFESPKSTSSTSSRKEFQKNFKRKN